MKSMTLLKAINDVQEDYIEAAAPKGYLPKEKAVFSWFNMRILASAAAVLLMAVFIGNTLFNKPQVLQVTPYMVLETMEEAEKITGFGLIAEESCLNSTSRDIAVYNESLIEILYYDEDSQLLAIIRKAEGNKDVSGDYNQYGWSENLVLDNREIRLEGNDDFCYKVTWQSNGYSYSLTLPQGLEQERISEIIETIH